MFAMSPAGVPEPSRRTGAPPVLYLHTRGGAENEATAVTATPAQTRNQICMGKYMYEWPAEDGSSFSQAGFCIVLMLMHILVSNCSSHLIYQFHSVSIHHRVLVKNV